MTNHKFDTAILIGAGAFGTSIASILAKNFKRVIVKVRSNDVYESFKLGKNEIYLPGKSLPDTIVGAKDWDEIESLVEGKVQLLVSGVPTSGIREMCTENKRKITKYLVDDVPFVSLSKGIDPDTLELSDDLFYDYFAEYRDSFCFLSGPSFAKEILEEQITLVSLAGRSKIMLERSAKMLNTNFFKVSLTYDVKGVLLGGALKNVIAIAAGIVEGLGFTHNTRAALITRGITEMLRFGKVYNARPETFYGLSGMGDLILTTTGELSRNRQFGLELAKGRKAQEIIESQRTVVEGFKTAKAVHELTKKYDIRATIFNGVHSVLYENKEPRVVIKELMASPSKFEID